MPGPITVLNQDPLNFSVIYYDNGDPAKRAALEAQWLTFDRKDPSTGQTYTIWSRPTSGTMDVTIDHTLPAGTPAGRYRIETFVPGKHATTRKALFTISHGFRTENGQVVHEEPLAVIDMYDVYDTWVSLGEFELDPIHYPLSGRVRQYGLSLEMPRAEVSFGPVRWSPLFAQPFGGVRFDSPVGTDTERAAPFPSGARYYKYNVWDGQWFDFNPFLSYYEYGYHTGADLNLPGRSDADKGKPIYAAGDGTVIYAGAWGTWGNIVVVEHPDALVTLPDGRSRRQVVYTRYGHVDKDYPARTGQRVSRGQLLATIGLAAEAVSGWHLHFDVSYTDILKKRPGHWPSKDKSKPSIMKEVLDNYVDPLRFIKDNHA